VSPERRGLLIVALFALIPGLVGGLLAFIGGPWAALVTLAVVGGASAGWLWTTSDRRALAALGGRTVDPVDDARLVNLVEGLCTAAGLRQPQLRVVDSSGLNAAASGRRTDRSTLAVTTGLLAELTRIELEAVLAEEIVRIRRRETVPATLAAGAFGVGAGLGCPSDRDVSMDQAAAALTRYPPGLVAALEKLALKGTAVPGSRRSVAHLWLADPLGPGVETGRPWGLRRTPLAQRIEALREL
jgi:heat shock protein HtpX